MKRKQAKTERRPAAPATTVERRAISLPPGLMLEADAALFELRKVNRKVSFSGLVEVALRELLSRPDLAGALQRHGASARRR